MLFINGKKKLVLAHRISYELYTGKILKNRCLHKCDNPGCVNPLHLFDGTSKQNSVDMAVKGRSGQAKLTAEDVLYIRKHYSLAARNGRKLARKFGVTVQNIHYVVHNRWWKHLGDTSCQ